MKKSDLEVLLARRVKDPPVERGQLNAVVEREAANALAAERVGPCGEREQLGLCRRP